MAQEQRDAIDRDPALSPSGQPQQQPEPPSRAASPDVSRGGLGVPRDVPGTRPGRSANRNQPPQQRRQPPAPRGGKRGNAMDALAIFGQMS